GPRGGGRGAFARGATRRAPPGRVGSVAHVLTLPRQRAVTATAHAPPAGTGGPRPARAFSSARSETSAGGHGRVRIPTLRDSGARAPARSACFSEKAPPARALKCAMPVHRGRALAALDPVPEVA